MKSKRILSGLITSAMLMTLLAGCGGAVKSSTPSTPSTASTPSTTSTNPPAEAKPNFPTKAITLIIPWAPGGASDIGARILAAETEKVLGVPIVCENKPGGGAWIGFNALLQSKKDGYTISACALPTLVGGYLDPAQKRTNTYKDFAPILNYTRDFSAISIHPEDKRFSSFKELVEYAKTKELTIGCGSPNSDDHVLVLKMNKAFGTKFIPLFSQGAADSMTNLLGRHVDAAILNVGETTVPAKNGQVKPMAIAAPDRVTDFLPNSPTIKEQMGLEIVSASSRGVVAAAGIPAENLKILIDAFSKAAKTDSFKSKLAAQGLPVITAAGDDYLKMFQTAESDLKVLAPELGW